MKARDVDRDLAIDFVEAAWVDGQLTHEEYDIRVDRLLRARTIGELERDLADLQGPNGARWNPEAGGVPVSRRARDHVMTVPVTSPTSSTTPQSMRTALICLVAAVILGLGYAIISTGRTTTLQAVPAGVVSVDSTSPQSAQGYRNLVSELDREVGETSAFEVRLQGHGAEGLFPAGPTGDAAEVRTWDGQTWSEPTRSASKRDRFNLRMVSADTVEEAYVQASLALEGDVDVELRLGVEQVAGVRSCLQATSRNSDGESITESYDCQGNLIDEGADE